MPSLIRLIIFLLFIAGIGYGAMFALVAFVEPGQKEVTVRIPARDLFNDSSTTAAGTDDSTAEADVTETPADPEATEAVDSSADQPE